MGSACAVQPICKGAYYVRAAVRLPGGIPPTRIAVGVTSRQTSQSDGNSRLLGVAFCNRLYHYDAAAVYNRCAYTQPSTLGVCVLPPALPSSKCLQITTPLPLDCTHARCPQHRLLTQLQLLPANWLCYLPASYIMMSARLALLALVVAGLLASAMANPWQRNVRPSNNFGRWSTGRGMRASCTVLAAPFHSTRSTC